MGWTGEFTEENLLAEGKAAGVGQGWRQAACRRPG